MRSEFYELDVAQAAEGNGIARDVRSYRDKVVQISGTFSGTVGVQATVDGVTWFEVDGGSFTARATLRSCSPPRRSGSR